MVKERRWSASKALFFVLFCVGQKRRFGYDEMKVGDASYYHGNVKKVLNHSYEMACSRCDEDLEEDYAYIQHEKELAL